MIRSRRDIMVDMIEYASVHAMRDNLIVEGYNNGYSIRQIARFMGIDSRTVHNVLVRNGKEIRDSSKGEG